MVRVTWPVLNFATQWYRWNGCTAYSSVSISTRYLKCLASPITKIWLGVVCHRRLRFNTVYLHAKFDGSRTVKYDYLLLQAHLLPRDALCQLKFCQQLLLHSCTKKVTFEKACYWNDHEGNYSMSFESSVYDRPHITSCSNNDSILHRFRDSTTFTASVTAYDLDKSFTWENTIQIINHVTFFIHQNQHQECPSAIVVCQCRWQRMRPWCRDRQQTDDVWSRHCALSVWLCQLRPAARALREAAVKTLVQTFISCCLDYCNALLYCITDKTASAAYPERGGAPFDGHQATWPHFTSSMTLALAASEATGRLQTG